MAVTVMLLAAACNLWSVKLGKGCQFSPIKLHKLPLGVGRQLVHHDRGDTHTYVSAHTHIWHKMIMREESDRTGALTQFEALGCLQIGVALLSAIYLLSAHWFF